MSQRNIEGDGRRLHEKISTKLKRKLLYIIKNSVPFYVDL